MKHRFHLRGEADHECNQNLRHFTAISLPDPYRGPLFLQRGLPPCRISDRVRGILLCARSITAIF